MNRWPNPLLARLAIFVTVPALIAITWLYLSLRSSLPDEAPLRLVQGVSDPVSLTRDRDGVPHINAVSDADAFFAVGYVHAQDRMWQLQLQKRMAQGRLSEVFGKATIESDVWFRTLGIYTGVDSAWASLSPDAQASLTAYANGVNQWISENHSLPIEFRILNLEPELWSERDSLAWVKVFALNLGANFRREMDHYIARKELSESQLVAFFPDYPTLDAAALTERSLHTSYQLNPLANLLKQLEDQFQLNAPRTGSNAWVVAGSHTVDGSAILANDPHLGLQIPSLWYAIDINTPTLRSSGMGLVGLPVVVLGRNSQIAWGATAMIADSQDLFLERADASGERYWANGQWQQFETRTESIDVRADFPQQLRRPYAPIRLTVRSTRNGPVISDHFGVFEQPVALSWTALTDQDTSYEAFFRLNYAADWENFQAALSLHVAPAMNMFYADRMGNIGVLSAGRIPVRKLGEGTLPALGWDDRYGWAKFVPPTQWARNYNPSAGYIVNANNRVSNDSDPYFISHDWAPSTRARRIEELLVERLDTGAKLSVEDMQRIQGDTIDLDARALMKELIKRMPDGEHADQAALYLEHWQGDMDPDSQAAAIFHVWMRHFRNAVFSTQLTRSWNNPEISRVLSRLKSNVRLNFLTQILKGQSPDWCEAADTSAVEGCNQALASSQKKALLELYKIKGDWSMGSWRWGDLQHTYYGHSAFSQSPFLKRFFTRRIGNGGSENSISVAASEFGGTEGYLQIFGAGFRQIVALGPDRIDHYYMNSTGQSGNLMSPHYDDMIEPFRDLQFRHYSDIKAPLPAVHLKPHVRSPADDKTEQDQ